MRSKPMKCAFLALVCALLAGCESLIVSAPESNQNVADFEAAWAWVDSIYPAFDIKQIDWDSVYAAYRPEAEQARGDEIHQVLFDMLSVLRDPHLYYTTTGGARFYPYVAPRLLSDKNEFSAYLLRSYFDEELLLAGKDGIEYGILAANIGYIRISHFNTDDMMDDLFVVMDSVRDTDGLIIDARNNTGGDSEHVDAVVSRFIDSTLAWPLAFKQDGVRIEPWPPIEPDEAHYRYVNPVVVLINGASLSGGELFPEVMKQLANVTVVGDTTAGASCNDRGDDPGDRRLPSGKLIHIPTWCITRYDGVPWELVGIAPDIRVDQTEEDIRQGTDRQLEYAIELLR
jgi:hypothetical protein